MKRIRLSYTTALAILILLCAGCNDSESDLLEAKLYFENDVIKVEVEADTYECELTSRLSKMAGNDVNVSYQIGDQSLVEKYNQKHGTNAQLMAAGNYAIGESSSVIKAGELYTEPCELSLKNITKGEDGMTYILPVVASTSDAALIDGSNVTYIVVKKPIIINRVYEFGSRWLDVRLPTAYKEMSSVTYEALLYATSWKNLGTIMGNEGNLILRTGDLNHPDNELQIAGEFAMQIDEATCTAYQKGKWYHVAFTYDASAAVGNIYLNGVQVATKPGGSKPFNLNERFCIGYAYDFDRYRKWNGYMSEVRLWSVARTANQIRESMMYVDPNSDGLVGYWKLNGEDYENRDGVWYVLDQSPNHYDATSNSGLRGENAGSSQTYREPIVKELRVELK